MLFIEILSVAIKSLIKNKVRTLLTMLGIIIGVGAVITMLAIGEGAKNSLILKLQLWGQM